MSWLQALLLGILQGIAEFLPISSDGHLELGKALLKVEAADNLLFTIVVHGATVLATIIVFWREIMRLLKGSFKFRMNEETVFVLKLIVSMIPVALVGFFMKDWVESFFNGDIAFVGAMELLTAAFLFAGYFMQKKEGKPVSYFSAFIIGIAQAIAVMPGLSRSGTTIATGLMLGVDKKKLAEFSFLMVIVPIMGANAMEMMDMKSATAEAGAASITAGVGAVQLVIGFLAAFFTGLIACTWMINLVKKGKLIWFAVYCVVIGLAAIGIGLLK